MLRCFYADAFAMLMLSAMLQRTLLPFSSPRATPRYGACFAASTLIAAAAAADACLIRRRAMPYVYRRPPRHAR